MNTTEEIMALAHRYATRNAIAVLEELYGTSPAYARQCAGEAKGDHQSLQTAVEQLVEQAKWAHHTPKLLSDADAAADLAGVARPGAEPVLYIHPDTFAMASAHVGAWKPGHELEGYIPLYTAPQQASQPDQNAVDAERYRWLRNRFLGSDYGWGNPATGVWVFETYAPVSADLDAPIDAAIAAQKGKP